MAKKIAKNVGGKLLKVALKSVIPIPLPLAQVSAETTTEASTDAQFWDRIKSWWSKKSTSQTKAQVEAADEEMAESLSQHVLAQTDFKKLKELYDDVKDKVAVLKEL